MASIQGIYIALFGRPADPEGLEYWTEMTKGGTDLSFLIGRLTAADEYEDLVEGKTNTEVINAIYQQLFDRDADPEGLAHYLEQLESGDQSIETIAIDILGGASGSDLLILDAKIDAADLFTASLNLAVEEDAYAGNQAELVGRNFIDSVDEDDRATQAEVDAVIESLLNPEVEQPENPDTGGGNPGGGNSGGGGTDDVAPTLEITSDDVDGVVTAGTSTQITFQFSEAVRNFSSSDVIVNGGTLSAFTQVNADTYTAIFTADAPMNEEENWETVRILAPEAEIRVEDGSYADRAYNPGVGAELDLVTTSSDVALFDANGNLVGEYDTLQEAEAAATTGGRIEVYGGAELDGDLTVDVARLTINGNGATLNGGIHILAESATIRGFEITGALPNDDVTEGASILIQANNVVINDNDLIAPDGSSAGIVTEGGRSGIQITDNEITGYSNYGIYLNPLGDVEDGLAAVVTGNIISDNRYGVLFENDGASDVSGNTFNGNVNGVGAWYTDRDTYNTGDVVTGNNHNEDGANVRILTSNGNTITGTAGDDVFVELASGNDTFDGGAGADIITGGVGNNTLLSSEGGDTYNATQGESITFRLTDTDHSGFLDDFTTIQYQGDLLGASARIPLSILLSGEDFEGAAKLIAANPFVASYGIERENAAQPTGFVDDFFMLRETDGQQTDPRFPFPIGNQSLVVYNDLGDDEFMVYFDADGNGDLDEGDAQIHIVGLNSFNLSFGSGEAQG
jgi:parallel beta-helix repeat protein